jgi:F-type H+-transporting ATPase subunit gamma
MQMVASAKMRLAQDHALKGRSYIGAIAEVLYHLQDEISEKTDPLLMENESDKDLVLVVNTDRGLCGGLNMNLFKELRTQVSHDAHYVTIGRKLNATFAKVGASLDATWSLGEPLSLIELRPIFEFLKEQFLHGGFGRVLVAYPSFVNTMVQRPVVRQLLPIKPEDLMDIAKSSGGEGVRDHDNRPFALEPSSKSLLQSILPLYLFYQLVQIVLEARASEQSARMVSMKTATENANGLIGELTLDYNKARQAQITHELMEISTAMAAME